MEKIFLEKKYTRDNCLIIQEVWGEAHLYDYFGNVNPNFPPIVNYVNDGIVEIWENKRAMKWFSSQLLKKNIQDKEFLNVIINEHAKVLSELKPIVKKNRLTSVGQLKKLIELLKRGTRTFVAFYYSGLDDKTPKPIRNTAIRARSKDEFYDRMDCLIKNTLEYLYPRVKGMAISILINEIEAPPNEKVLKGRFKNCLMIISSKPKITSIENFVRHNQKYHFFLHKVGNSNYLKGQVARPGHVTGRVRIIKRKNQVGSLLSDEILVSPMTTPDFISAMKKAGAIITDEGGITCHAAIVARELGIPCIIGTKIATQVLHDGDLVEVDANKGIIRKLKS
ncbi:MAG: PEP-utilizing enzyme [Patescibacteria group bacterium]